MNDITRYFTSSIGKKQTVAATGLFLIVYVAAHLLGNLLILGGPKPFNGYAAFLAGLRPGLNVIEFALFLTFVIHAYVTVLIVLENIRARGDVAYTAYKEVGRRSLATRLMPFTGTFLLAFIVWHIFDFTLIDHHGSRSIIAGISYGLYGVVYNSFTNSLHSLAYIVAMGCLGFHLAHGIQSFFQTFGFLDERNTPLVSKLSNFLGIAVAFGYSMIPVFVMLHNARYHPGI